MQQWVTFREEGCTGEKNSRVARLGSAGTGDFPGRGMLGVRRTLGFRIPRLGQSRHG